ncbi:hypothetical protein PIB30_067553 [Stylosanthes scabra]|uniref:RRM domain-containing protein n=1 Tax=Stylosanthes scabra TaxID=79078 RepID=A0ABU6UM33_9FABA|nr:hypothetical protein [Stylosanthes scabra]
MAERRVSNGIPRRNSHALENFQRLERRSFTLFVDNISHRVSTQDLWEMFSNEGQVVDVFLSNKIRINNAFKFAFVRFAFKNHALRASRNLDGCVLEGVKLMFAESKYERERRVDTQDSNHTHKVVMAESMGRSKKKEGSDKRSFESVLLGLNIAKKCLDENTKCGKVDHCSNEVVKGFVDMALVEKLKRSIIGESAIHLNSEDIIPRIYNDWHTFQEIKEMESFKMVMTFATVEDKDEALEEVSEEQLNPHNFLVNSTSKPGNKKDDGECVKDTSEAHVMGVDENCEKSNSMRCIHDDRRSEEVIKETQLTIRNGRNMIDDPRECSLAA